MLFNTECTDIAEIAQNSLSSWDSRHHINCNAIQYNGDD